MSMEMRTTSWGLLVGGEHKWGRQELSKLQIISQMVTSVRSWPTGSWVAGEAAIDGRPTQATVLGSVEGRLEGRDGVKVMPEEGAQVARVCDLEKRG